jgi:mannose-6-phosphate isomerase-like protein (cupin superfamily)
MDLAKIVSRGNAEYYRWGEECDGWHLVRSPELSVIEERMPTGTSEVRHYHVRARQFFYVLGGELTMELEGRECVLRDGEGIEIAPGQRHQVMNRGEGDVRMLVVSQPMSHGDRVIA